MKAKRLVAPENIHPRCEKIAGTGEGWYDGDPHRCAKYARYYIDGHKYCYLHAGDLALKHLMGENHE